MANTSAGAVSLATIGVCMAMAACAPAVQEDQRVADDPEDPMAGNATAGQSADGTVPDIVPGLLALGQRGVFGNLALTPLAVMEDSRCPEGVDCAWPGRVVLRVAVEQDGNRSEITLESGHATQVGAASIVLRTVQPVRTMANRENLTDQYRFGFTISAAAAIGAAGR